VTIDAALRAVASEEGKIALVTVVGVSGSAPRHSGSRMAVRADGSIVGTVGGGRGEAEARKAALAALASGEPSVLRVEMQGVEATGVDLICGGVSTMWIHPIVDASPYAAAVAAAGRGESVVLVESADSDSVAVLGEDGSITAGMIDSFDSAALSNTLMHTRESGEPTLSETGKLLCTPYEGSERLLILGGGHVGLTLARVAVGLSFLVTVADPRPEYSGPGRFPPEVELKTSSFADAVAAFPFGGRTYVVVVSPGHLGDLECARAVLAKDFRYAGLIGSQRKSRMLIEQLIAEGFPAEKVESLRTPIGFPIGAETPEEIAISIAAELVAVRRDSSSLGRIDEERKLRRSS
jgi:xanthine dehydrogenase accessory factor